MSEFERLVKLIGWFTAIQVVFNCAMAMLIIHAIEKSH
jgi:hypothetical protein